MQAIVSATARAFKGERLNIAQVTVAAIAIVFLLQIELVFTKSVNWDEFYHFSQIHRYLQGRPVQWLQVPYVWLFSWVPSLAGDNIDHIQLIRLLILPFELITIVVIVATGQRIAGREEGLFCGLLYVTGGYVFLHAFALRADMIAACLLTLALWIGICRSLRTREFAAIGLLFALAFVATIKSVLYAPAFLGVALYRLQKPSHRWILVGATVSVLAAGVILLWVAPSLPEGGLMGLLRDIGGLGQRSISRMFSAGIFPQARWLQEQVLRAPLLAIAIVLAFAYVLRRDRAPKERLLVLSLLLPLCTVAFYRNAYPYHFVFILPPAVIAVAPAIAPLRRYGMLPPILLLSIAISLSLSQDRNILPRQRTIQHGVHEIFPEPVTYIDDCGMLGDFPRAINHFASGWALENYRRKGLPTYSMAMKTEPVPLLLADSTRYGTVCFDILHRRVLMPQDQRALSENYLQHWGNVFVAGKSISAGNENQVFEIAVPGTYTVEGGEIVIDGRPYSAGNVLELSRGPHAVSGERPEHVTLRWGNHLHRPAYPWPEGPLLTAF